MVAVAESLVLVRWVLVGVLSVSRGIREMESSVDLDRAGGVRRERCGMRELLILLSLAWKDETLADMAPNESLERVARGTRRRLPRRDAASSVERTSLALSNEVAVGVSSFECRFDLGNDDREDDNGVFGAVRRIRSRARARLGSSDSLMSSSDPRDEREWEESPR